MKVINDTTGLSSQGRMVLAAAVGVTNLSAITEHDKFRYLLPPTMPTKTELAEGVFEKTYNFSEYPALQLALTSNSSGALIDTRTPLRTDVAVGFAYSNLEFTTWAIAIEEPHSNIYAETRKFRNIVIASAFGIAGFMVLLTIPVAHFAVKPIYRLRMATEQTMLRFLDDKKDGGDGNNSGDIGGGGNGGGGGGSGGSGGGGVGGGLCGSSGGEKGAKDSENKDDSTSTDTEKSLSPGKGNTSPKPPLQHATSNFRVPMKVRESQRFFRDELTDLTETYNRMVDELVKQYFHLEDRVRDRTRESEAAKIQAESANEAKSLFIANITHELRTPLNGILGMTAVSLTETDPSKMRRSLKLIFKSGEVLLELLTDLLTFSKNQVGNITLDEKEFTITDLISHLRTIYDPQAVEKNINLSYLVSPPTVANMVLYGDFSRILQILMNLISNGLKFTKPSGDIKVRVKLLGDELKTTFLAPIDSTVIGRQSLEVPPLPITLASTAASPSTDNSNPQSPQHPPKLFVRTHRSRMFQSAGSGGVSPIEQGKGFTALDLTTSNGGGRYSPTPQVRTLSNIEKPIQDGNARESIESRKPNSVLSVGGSRRGSFRAKPIAVLNTGNNGLLISNGTALPLTFEFEVEDTGPGIEKSFQSQVFEPFIQGDQALSRKFGGTGLGLSICRQLSDVLGGTITLRSEVGVGSIFTLRVPLQRRNNVNGNINHSFDLEPSTSHVSTATAESNRSSASITMHRTRDSSFSDRTPIGPVVNGSAFSGNTSGSTSKDGNRTLAIPRSGSLSSKDKNSVNTTLSVPGAISNGYFSARPRTRSGSGLIDNSTLTTVPTIPPSSEAETLTAASIRVLVAEDNLINQEIMKRMLRLEGIKDIEWALDGEQVVTKVEDAIKSGVHYDIVFMDVQMPKMNGLEATKIIRGTLGYPYTIVALTAFVDDQTREMCLSVGMNSILSKPIMRLELHQALSTYCPGIPLHEPVIAKTLDSPN